MIKLIQGNLFESKAEAWANTTNCVGVGGKGIALEFKKRFPENFAGYCDWCKSEFAGPGEVYVFENWENPRFILNVATKKHWRNPSKIEWIVKGLENIKVEIKNSGIKSVAIPALGCQNGNLDFNDVKPLIVAAFENFDCEVELYLPLV